ncbi:MAG: carotenoid oxygenase family protein [Rhizobiaceae bacterium]|nr:carotenoid oxygenase family protein [Rhizobiaceae bacterium]
MDRREFGKLFIGAATFAGLPHLAHAAPRIGAQEKFHSALAEKPWLLGYLGTREPLLQSELKIEHGKVPSGFSGRLFRNGPARHEIGQDRFSHWFDAPGMIQRFTISGDRISHLGRLTDTSRNHVETDKNRIAYHGFGTSGSELSSGGSADGQNPANISLLNHAGELLALWEGGSPHIIDPETLSSSGIKKWTSDTAGLPFGAHPRRDSDGSVWNIGYSANPAAILIYHLSATGELLQTHLLPQMHTPMLHDFLITDSKLILVMPPFRASKSSDGAFLDQFEWNAQQSTQILVIDKSDLTHFVELETEAFWVFHFGNAYDISSSEIGFDFALHSDPGFMTKDAYQVMDGSWNGGAQTTMHYAQARLDLSKRTVHIERNNDHGQVEFVQIDPREQLSRHSQTLMLTHSGGKSQLGWNTLTLLDRNSGNANSFTVSDTELIEEHLIVPKPDSNSGFWIIGTSLDWQRRRTSLSIYDGQALEDGPVVKAVMEYPIPFGLHGLFLPL